MSKLLDDKTIAFSISEEKEKGIKSTIREAYQALNEKGYRAVTQIVGYLISEDPTYITTHNEARKKMTKFKREEILEKLVQNYVEENDDEENDDQK